MSLKEEVVNIVSKLPDDFKMEDLMYKLYVLEKIHEGEEALENGDVISVEDLKEEIQTW